MNISGRLPVTGVSHTINNNHKQPAQIAAQSSALQSATKAEGAAAIQLIEKATQSDGKGSELSSSRASSEGKGSIVDVLA